VREHIMGIMSIVVIMAGILVGIMFGVVCDKFLAARLVSYYLMGLWFKDIRPSSKEYAVDSNFLQVSADKRKEVKGLFTEATEIH